MVSFDQASRVGLNRAGLQAMLTRGSEWRRWDLHVHTPGTALNNQFGNWDEYLAAIESHPDVKVIGVTDYMTLTNYSQLKEYKAQGRLQNIDLLIPNIEFRLAPPTDRATAVNLHLLISPEDPNHETELLNALGRLTWRYGGRNYSCLPDQLMALGRAYDQAAVEDHVALRVGVTQFKADFTRLQEWYQNEGWLRENSLTAVEAGKDGLSGFLRDGAWGGYREEITRFAQIIFSGRPGERVFWLGERSAEDLLTINRLGGSKPCAHGSDAHQITELFQPEQDRFCWIKADSTFEGLKQILYEPADRIYIGPTPPLYHDQARVIRSVRLHNANGWFDDVEIPLNPGLVAIIGQKGSGKSALAELIALAAESWMGDESASFLERAGKHLDDMTVALTWDDDSSSEVRVGDHQSTDPKLRYLSQRFVERLCADDHPGIELLHEIEAVIFSYLDPTDTLNASNFEELRAIRTEAVRAEGRRLREDILRSIQEECALRDNAAKLAEKRGRIKTLAEERDGLQKQLPQAVTDQEAQVQQELQTHRQSLAVAQRDTATEKHLLQKIADLRSRTVSFEVQMNRFYSEIEPVLKEIGISDGDLLSFRPKFTSAIEPTLAKRERDIRASLTNREGNPTDPDNGTIRWLQARIEQLTKQETADKARQERVKNIQRRIAAIGVEISRIDTEIKQIEGPEKARINALRDSRREDYVSYFRNLTEEQRVLEALYGPVTNQLQTEGTAAQERELEFSIRWDVNLESWLERGAALFDQRKTIPHGTYQGLGRAARDCLLPAWTSGSPDAVGQAMEQFLEAFRDANLPPARYLRSGITLRDVLTWVYEIEHVKLNYSLKYNGTELDKLSPGTKGIVLLILYLGMDTDDTRPLIVDQPDENLDNESIYQLLSAYFRKAKTRRQIILITHNPNLVVNTDAEQIVVATATRREGGLPHVTYRAGSLENSIPPDRGIRQQVCRILEGGSDAFRKREQRYALDS